MIDINELIKRTKVLSLLYVEDNEEARTEIVEIFAVFFDDITIAVDGEEGIEKFLAGDFDLIITDIRMPKLNGIEMIEKIREVDRNIPIIVASAHDETSYFTETIKFGIESYLLKPFTIDDLVGVLYKVTENIFIKNELNTYKESLEVLIEEKVEEINQQNKFIVQQARLASMGEMINNIAHHWRQPLNRINSSVAILSRIVNSDSIDRKMFESKITSIEQNTRYMSDTIEDFTHFLHPEKNKSPFMIGDSLKKVLELMVSRMTLFINGVDVVFTTDEDIEVVSFEKEYQQAILTLLNNALDIFESNITKYPKIEISIYGDDEKVYLSISDNGGGIAEKDIDRIFEPYFSTKFANVGTGLGLYMSKMLIEKSMYGQLKVKNIDEGACFEIQIPKGEIND